MIKNSHRDSVGYFLLLMSVCGQLGTGAGSLLAGPPVHWADLCQGPGVRAVVFVMGMETGQNLPRAPQEKKCLEI